MFKNMEQEKVYLTKEGKERFEKELNELKRELEEKIREEMPSTASSEPDEEYISFQENLGQLRSKIEDIEDVLNNCEVISYDPKSHCQIVRVGCRVEVDNNGEREELTIVGSLEANPDLKKISNQSPIGKALMGHKRGDEVQIKARTIQIFKIKKITYGV
jgi:transcription elongation factor GreA